MVWLSQHLQGTPFALCEAVGVRAGEGKLREAAPLAELLFLYAVAARRV